MEASHVRFIAGKSIKFISFAICVGITHYLISIRSIVSCVKSISIIYVNDPAALTFCCVFGIPHTRNFLLHFLINFLFGQTEIAWNDRRRKMFGFDYRDTVPSIKCHTFYQNKNDLINCFSQWFKVVFQFLKNCSEMDSRFCVCWNGIVIAWQKWQDSASLTL